MTTTIEAIAQTELIEGRDFIVTATHNAYPLNKEEAAFLSDFNFDNFVDVEVSSCHEGCAASLVGERTALYDFAEMLDNEEILYTELGLVRGLVDGIKESVASDIEGIDPSQFE